jgi:hypothetical protein
LPGTAQSKRLKESHEFTRLLLGKADMRVVQTRQMIPSGAYLDRDCFVAILLAMTSTYDVIASEAKQSRRGPAREQASGLHH